MGSEWTQRRLKDCAKWYSGGTPSKSNPAYWGGGIPWISAKSLSEFFVQHSEDTVTSDAIGNGTRLVPKDTILFVVRGMSLKKELRMGITARPVTFNQDLKALVAEDGVDPYFLAYAIRAKTREILALVEEAGHGTGVLPTSVIESLKLPIPLESQQKVIARLFRTLDDKIELNRQMNATLEAMAQALFKSWFVDFDPVIDNALAAGNPIPEPLQKRAAARQALGEQRKPLPPEIQQQFPSRFVFTEELGWIPEGWEVSTVGHQVETVGGGTPSTKNPDFWDGGSHAFCTPKDMSRLGSIVLTETERYLTDAGVSKVSSGLSPSGTVLMSSRAPIGYLAISNTPIAVNQGVIAMLPSSHYGAMYLLCWTQNNMPTIKDRANGSTFLEISKKNFRPIPFLVPNNDLLRHFNGQVGGLYARLVSSVENTATLAQLRDTLLPKLLSGELRVPEAERQIAAQV
ncbi:restriction endonuclease subunit S [Alkalilimnicola sp. S0819]|uniref:restriction endonuclease subunit S n=1 Tax=Alkalilimnicola sp. S0819 TaxID=2613922 RepID=UPI001261DF22|nr:restriction endonuclease subunit S [Alkalilimnicola sp. S0819]KAB7622694.1 restriction endonuclease subunit S [Alkalilimnicola sp. S0819]MPQ17332.1 restriction endonuclease subunit S [Alkalilimnicola sp. S0819]